MTTGMKLLTRSLAITAALLAAAPAHAVLLDHGPADPVLVWPQWYRDLNGKAVGLCKSQVQSPNPNSAFAPMCFPTPTNPAGFAGNLGDEIFYNYLNVDVQGVGFTLRYVAALEAAYVPGPSPTHGQEVVFARLRFTMNVSQPGTYTVTHPFGVQVFPDVPANGPRSLFFTIDVPLGVPGDFDGALQGHAGPWIEWTGLDATETLSVGGQTFLGDPNYPHIYTGSPFGTNFVEVIGPAGIDGAGGTTLSQPFGAVLGQVWTAPIATPFKVQKAVYSRDLANNLVDVWATSAPAQQLVITGTTLPSLRMKEYKPGFYYAHIEESAAAIPPAGITVTNLSSNPISAQSVPLVDQLDADATWVSDGLGGGTLTVNAITSDTTSTAGALVVSGPLGGVMNLTAAGAYAFSRIVPPSVPAVEPPQVVEVISNAGGVYAGQVVVLQGAPMNKSPLPIATSFVATVNGTGPTTIALPDATVTAVVIGAPAKGTAVGGLGSITFTPALGASGADSITYVVENANGLSNAATISFSIPFVAAPPTGVADNFAIQVNGTRNLAILANDTAAAGTTIDPASVLVTGTGASFSALNGGLATYRAGAATGNFTFNYTVANTSGTRSASTPVTMVVFGGPESASMIKVNYTISRNVWLVSGSTNWFGANLTQLSATCWLGSANAPTAATLIGKTPIDTTGKWQLAPAGATPTPVNGQIVTCQTSSGAFARGAVVAK